MRQLSEGQRDALKELVCGIFRTKNELRAFLTEWGRVPGTDFPDDKLPKTQFASSLVQVLEGRSLIDAQFFAAMRRRRPRQADEIDAAELMVLGPAEHSPTDTEPGAPAAPNSRPRGAHLPDELLARIQSTAIDVGLHDNRNLIMDFLDPHFVANQLEVHRAPGLQVLKDLQTLNRCRDLEGGKRPLQQWLEGAIAIAKPSDVTLLKEALEAVKASPNIERPSSSEPLEPAGSPRGQSDLTEETVEVNGLVTRQALESELIAVLGRPGTAPFLSALANQLAKAGIAVKDVDPPGIARVCLDASEPKVVKSLGQAVKALADSDSVDRALLRDWVCALLPKVIGVNAMAVVVRRQADGTHDAYELQINAECRGLIDALVALNRGRPASFKVEEVEGKHFVFRSGQTIDHKPMALMPQSEVADLFDAQAEQYLLGGYGHERLSSDFRDPESARIKFLLELEDGAPAFHLVFSEKDVDAVWVRRFHRAIVRRGLPADVVLQASSSDASVKEIQMYLLHFLIDLFKEQPS